jgi:hypothetical protein
MSRATPTNCATSGFDFELSGLSQQSELSSVNVLAAEQHTAMKQIIGGCRHKEHPMSKVTELIDGWRPSNEAHPVVSRLEARQQHSGDEGDRLSEMSTKKTEFSQRQADRLMKLAEETRDPQLRPQLVIMSRAWIDQSAKKRDCGSNYLMLGAAIVASLFPR